MNTSTQSATPAPSDKRLYKSSIKFTSVILPRGQRISFKGGIYVTDNEEEIEYLDREIAQHGFGGTIFIDPNARTISAEEANPMLALRKKFFAEFIAEQQAHMNPNNDMGTSAQEQIKPASTSDIASVVAGGDASLQNARLIALANKVAPPTGSQK